MRPKWVAYNFLGLDKINPNRSKWQPRVEQYNKNSLKIFQYVYVWFCSDFFYRSSIVSFFLKSEWRKKNYYGYRSRFDKNLNRLMTNRLKSGLKVKLYNKQNGLCAVCSEIISEREFVNCSSKIYISSMLLRNVPKDKSMVNKFYQALDNKILLHDRCYPAFCKNNLLLKKRVFSGAQS